MANNRSRVIGKALDAARTIFEWIGEAALNTAADDLEYYGDRRPDVKKAGTRFDVQP